MKTKLLNDTFTDSVNDVLADMKNQINAQVEDTYSIWKARRLPALITTLRVVIRQSYLDFSQK